jgi:hypothetical protein
MALDTDDKKYIADEINRSRVQFRDEVEIFFKSLIEEGKNNMIALKESFQSEVKMLAELIQDRPTRNEVREMIQEEVQQETLPIKNRLTTIESVLSI